jgi:hypothetical protein
MASEQLLQTNEDYIYSAQLTSRVCRRNQGHETIENRRNLSSILMETNKHACKINRACAQIANSLNDLKSQRSGSRLCQTASKEIDSHLNSSRPISKSCLHSSQGLRLKYGIALQLPPN